MEKKNFVTVKVVSSESLYNELEGYVVNTMIVDVNGKKYGSVKTAPLSDEVAKQLTFDLPRKVLEKEFDVCEEELLDKD